MNTGGKELVDRGVRTNEAVDPRHPHAVSTPTAALLPTAMKLLDEWNWYLPRRLDWLPRLNVEGELPQVVATEEPEPPAEERRTAA